MKNFKLKNNSALGITLISLVITIIILLILSGVTIATLTQNSLFEKAQLAKERQTESEIKEKITLILAEYEIEKQKNNELTLLEYLNQHKDQSNITGVKDNNDSTIKVTLDGYSITISEENLSILEIKANNNIDVSYTIKSYENNIFKILLSVKDLDNGINKIYTPNGKIISGNAKNEVLIDYDVNLGTEYIFEITSESGITTKEKICIREIPIAFKVNIGAFIDYDAGVWTQEQINLLGDLYNGNSIPTKDYLFGGFSVGDSRNNSISSLSTIYTGGWRVLSIDGAKINIIHAGLPESYSHGPLSSKSISIFENRDWSMYLNDYSTQLHIASLDEIYSIRGIYNFSNVGRYYYTSTAYNQYYLQAMEGESYNYYGPAYKYGIPFGIRPVITLKENIGLTGGNGTYDTPYTIKLINQ